VDHKVRVKNARPDVTAEQFQLPTAVEHLSSLSAALLETMYAGPRLITPPTVVSGVVAVADGGVRRKKPKADGDVVPLPAEAALGVGDSVQVRDLERRICNPQAL
jgi:hypothetical protein